MRGVLQLFHKSSKDLFWNCSRTNLICSKTDLGKTFRIFWNFSRTNLLTLARTFVEQTRNILKKDIRRLSNTDDKRNQIRWFWRNSHLPLCMLESKTSEVVVLFLSLFCLVLCTSNSFRWAICIWIFFFNFRHSPTRVWEQCFKS